MSDDEDDERSIDLTPEERTEAQRAYNKWLRAQLDSIALDANAYGTGVMKMNEDGKIERVDPEKVGGA